MSRKKSAIIAGIAGQDGSYLAELLIGNRSWSE
jgi:GDP-D-mannose dehydratase